MDILRITAKAHAAHGVERRDYEEYRRYCTARIARLRARIGKAAPQADAGAERTRQALQAELLLFQAERAWAYGMDLRKDVNLEPRKRFHAVKRLRRAAGYALELQKAAADRTNEADAYLSAMRAMLAFERKQWTDALQHAQTAVKKYEAIAAATPALAAAAGARQRDLVPVLRYCAYTLGVTVELPLVDAKNGGQEDGRESSSSALHGRYLKQPLVDGLLGGPEKAAAAVRRACELQPRLASAEAGTAEKLRLVDELMAAFAQAQQQSASDALDVLVRLTSVQRAQLLMREALESAAPAPATLLDVSSETLARLVAASDMMLQHMRALSGGDKDDSEQHVKGTQLASDTAVVRAVRCLLLSVAHERLGGTEEAHALAVQGAEVLAAATETELAVLQAILPTAMFGEDIVLRSFLDLQRLRCRAPQELPPALKYLSARTMAHPSSVARARELCSAESLAAPRAVPCRPFFFDVAHRRLDAPGWADVEAAMRGAGAGKATGWFGGLF